LRELGGEARAEASAASVKIRECASDPKMTDNAKLLEFDAVLSNPEELIRPIFEFADQIKEDMETKEALKLFAEDELSSAKWLKYACAALNAPSAETPINSVVMTEEIERRNLDFQNGPLGRDAKGSLRRRARVTLD